MRCNNRTIQMLVRFVNSVKELVQPTITLGFGLEKIKLVVEAFHRLHVRVQGFLRPYIDRESYVRFLYEGISGEWSL